MSYTFATFSAPLIIGLSVLSFFQQARILLLLLYLYWVVLYVMAIQAVNQLSLLRAIGAGMIALLFTIFVGSLIYGLILLLGFW